MHLLVNSLVVISLDTLKVNITYGDDIDFKFNTTHFINSTYFWEKNGTNISTGHKYKGTTTNILTIHDAESGDEGIYTLVINTDLINTTSFSTLLSICKLHEIKNKN